MIPTIAIVKFSLGDDAWRVVLNSDNHPSYKLYRLIGGTTPDGRRVYKNKCEQLSTDGLGCAIWIPLNPSGHNIDAILRFALLTTPEDAPAIQGKRVLIYNVGNIGSMPVGKAGHYRR